MDEDDEEATPLAANTQDSVKSKSGLTGTLTLSVAACVLGTSFQFGYCTGVVNAPQQVIEQFLNDSNVKQHEKSFTDGQIRGLWSLIVSIWAVGGMIGGVTGGAITNRIGRKGSMGLNNLIIIAGGLLLGFSKYSGFYQLLIAGRFVTGLACGLSTVVAPVYLSEVAPVNLRGAAGTINQFAIVLAILISDILGLDDVMGNSTLWPYLLGLVLVPAGLQLLLLPIIPESPRYLLLNKDRRNKAEHVLIWLRGTTDVQNDIQEMVHEQQVAKTLPKVTVLDLFRKRFLRIPLIISVCMMLSQQLSGINAVIYYSTDIFENAGLSHSSAQYATIGTGAVNVVMTFVSALLVDRAGRRTLHLFGLGGMWVFAIILTIGFLWQSFWTFMSYVSIIAALCYIVSFATGPGSIPWFITAELFGQDSRPSAVSIAVLVNWIANFIIGIGFPSVEKALGNYSFLPFVGFLSIFWLFTYFKVPETKNRTIEEITAQFRSEDDENASVQYQRLEPDDMNTSDQ